jgi:beta-fructofuranosidase
VSLRLADHWVWDSWLVEDGVDFHLFHARSTDLESWEVLPPLSRPAGFGHLEVPQVCVIDDQPVLVFSCLSIHQDPARLAGPPDGGVYVVLAGRCSARGNWPTPYRSTIPVCTPVDWCGIAPAAGCSSASRTTEESGFVGEICDPIPVNLDGAQIRIAR